MCRFTKTIIQNLELLTGTILSSYLGGVHGVQDKDVHLDIA